MTWDRTDEPLQLRQPWQSGKHEDRINDGSRLQSQGRTYLGSTRGGGRFDSRLSLTSRGRSATVYCRVNHRKYRGSTRGGGCFVGRLSLTDKARSATVLCSVTAIGDTLSVVVVAAALAAVAVRARVFLGGLAASPPALVPFFFFFLSGTGTTFARYVRTAVVIKSRSYSPWARRHRSQEEEVTPWQAL